MFVLFPSLRPSFVPQKARSSRVGVYYAQRGLAFSAPGYFVHPHMLSTRNRSPHPRWTSSDALQQLDLDLCARSRCHSRAAHWRSLSATQHLEKYHHIQDHKCWALSRSAKIGLIEICFESPFEDWLTENSWPSLFPSTKPKMKTLWWCFPMLTFASEANPGSHGSSCCALGFDLNSA